MTAAYVWRVDALGICVVLMLGKAASKYVGLLETIGIYVRPQDHVQRYNTSGTALS